MKNTHILFLSVIIALPLSVFGDTEVTVSDGTPDAMLVYAEDGNGVPNPNANSDVVVSGGPAAGSEGTTDLVGSDESAGGKGEIHIHLLVADSKAEVYTSGSLVETISPLNAGTGSGWVGDITSTTSNVTFTLAGRGDLNCPPHAGGGGWFGPCTVVEES